MLAEASRQGTPLFEGDERVALTIGRRLGVAWLVTGGYQRVGDQVRITARVVDVQTGAVVRTAKVDGAVSQIFELQDRIVTEVGSDLGSSEPPMPARADAAVASRPETPGRSDAGRGEGGSALGRSPVTGALRLDPGVPASGARVEGNVPATGRLAARPVVAAGRTDNPPSIDGLLDDLVWRSATRVIEFVQQRPLEGAPATEQTEVYIAYDSQNLYFGIYAHYSDPGLIRANRVDRDQTGRDDTVQVMFDPFLDQQRGYSFSVNGYGVQADSIMTTGGGFGGGGPGGGGGGPGGGGGGGGFRGAGPGDSSWNALYESAGTLVEDGWTAEMAIPFKSLRYPSRGRGETHRWGFQIQRDIESKNESVVWAPMSRDVMGFLRQMGTLDGLVNLSTSRNLEVLPTFTALQVGNLSGTTGAYVTADAEEGGLNVKYGITSNLTFDFTYNPDFSQVESDRPQIEVNQRFPLFYPELRPFFLEGQEIFSIQGPVTFVHTRTIVDPQFGAKLTGKVGKSTLGVVVANDEAPGKVDNRSDPAFDRPAQFFMGRFRYDLYPESHIGMIFTDREFLDAFSRLGGVDSQFAIGRNRRVGLRAIFTDHRDAAGVRRTGSMYDASFRKEGRNLSYFIASFGIDPDFKTDAGFVRRLDQRQTSGNISLRWWPESWIINWGPRFNYDRNYDYEGVLQDEGLGIGLNVQFARNINLNTNWNRDMERYGGINFWKSRYSLGGGVNTSRRFGFGGGFNTGEQIRFVSHPFLGTSGGVNVFMNLRPLSRLQSEINVNTSRFVDTRTDPEVEVFDVKIFRSLTTYQFTDRFLIRNILEYNTFDKAALANLLFTYRVNAGTVFYVGYDDHYRRGDKLNALLFPTIYQRTNRAIFTKLQYLFRY